MSIVILPYNVKLLGSLLIDLGRKEINLFLVSVEMVSVEIKQR